MDHVQHDRSQTILAVCGIVGPFVFAATVIALAALRPGYSHIAQTISALGEVGQRYAIVQDINFVVLGALVLAFSYGLQRGIGDGAGSKLGPAFVGVFGLGVALAGFFPCGPCADFSAPTYNNTTHAIAATIAFLGFLPAPFFLWRRMKSDPAWTDLARWSLIFGIAIVVLEIATNAGTETAIYGLLQRLQVAAIFLFLEIIALRLYRKSGAMASQAAAG